MDRPKTKQPTPETHPHLVFVDVYNVAPHPLKPNEVVKSDAKRQIFDQKTYNRMVQTNAFQGKAVDVVHMPEDPKKKRTRKPRTTTEGDS